MNKRTKKTDDPNVIAFQGMQSLLEILDPQPTPKTKTEKTIKAKLKKKGATKSRPLPFTNSQFA